MRQMVKRVGFLVLFNLVSYSHAATNNSEDEFHLLVSKLVTAQRHFDNQALAELLHPDYVEISPAGEVDHRDKVLGFYDQSNKVKGKNSPQIELSELVANTVDNYAFIRVRETFITPNSERSFAMRVSFALTKIDGNWLFYNAQYTGIRP
ncbi:nuclear transport factor 2 family protein [Flavobacterium sp. W21_SRS_FM6]|uniref:nuclear transport factor 2 family protein n=1 Tax=Flavobacterium sp. W21_SRS_FM6 TaxID=3240268 RepID=UPI003F911A21